MFQIANAMVDRGHVVNVICGGVKDKAIVRNGVRIQYVKSEGNAEFRVRAVDFFSQIHEVEGIDVVEAAEYGADAIGIKNKYPHLPLVVKLHNPTFLVQSYNQYEDMYGLSLIDRLKRARLKVKQTLARARHPRTLIESCMKARQTEPPKDLEYELTFLADSLISPSLKLKSFIESTWRIDKPIGVIPNIYIPSEDFLAQETPSTFKNFLFIGKLMIFKGVIDLCRAIPLVLKKHPHVSFTFVGRSMASPKDDVLMVDYLKTELAPHLSNVNFVEEVPLDQVPNYMKQSDAVIVPSLWENFPTVCLEAMSAGKLVIGTDVGGIPEMLDNDAGLLAQSRDHKDLARAIIFAVENPEKMRVLAENGRRKVLAQYSQNVVGKQMEVLYQSTMSKFI
jgi:glycogen(starch) synthase